MKRILLSSLMIVATLAAAAAGGTGAFFSDTETSTGNTFTAGAIDLKVDNTSYYNGVLSPDTSWTLTDLTIEKFFNFLDLKPGDVGEDTISLHVDTNDAYLCANVKLTSNDENGQTEPEAAVDLTPGANQGELAGEVNFIWWADDGDSVLEVGETVLPGGNFGSVSVGSTTTVPLADSMVNIWDGVGPVDGDTTVYVGKAWCFGTLTPEPLPVGEYPNGPIGNTGGVLCDGSSLGNETQTDSLTADVSFTSVQSRNNPNFVCVPERPPVLTACTDTSKRWADSSVNADQGRRKDGALVLVDRRNPSSVFGPAQTSGLDSDVGFPAGSFYSLGFNVGTTSSRSITVSFDNNIILDTPGADVKIYEVTGGQYPDEKVKVEVSQNGSTWFEVAANAIRDEEIDISSSGLAWAKYVRVTDQSDIALFPTDGDGYDLDAVEAIHCGEPLEI